MPGCYDATTRDQPRARLSTSAKVPYLPEYGSSIWAHATEPTYTKETEPTICTPWNSTSRVQWQESLPSAVTVSGVRQWIGSTDRVQSWALKNANLTRIWATQDARQAELELKNTGRLSRRMQASQTARLPGEIDWAKHAAGKSVALNHTERLAKQQASALKVLGSLVRHHRGLFGKGVNSPADLFAAIDINKNGMIERDEFTAALVRLDFGLTATQYNEIWDGLDVDSSGTLDYDELVSKVKKWRRNDTVRRAPMRPRHRASGRAPNPSLGMLLDAIHTGIPHPAARTFRPVPPGAVDDDFTALPAVRSPRAPVPLWAESLRADKAKAAAEASGLPATPPDWAKHSSGVGIHLDEVARLKRSKAAALGVLRQMIKGNRLLFGKEISDPADLFHAIDTDRSGVVDKSEFEKALSRLGLGLSPDQLNDLWNGLDLDGSGSINYTELLSELSSATVVGPPQPPDSRRGLSKAWMVKNAAAVRGRPFLVPAYPLV